MVDKKSTNKEKGGMEFQIKNNVYPKSSNQKKKKDGNQKTTWLLQIDIWI